MNKVLHLRRAAEAATVDRIDQIKSTHFAGGCIGRPHLANQRHPLSVEFSIWLGDVLRPAIELIETEVARRPQIDGVEIPLPVDAMGEGAGHSLKDENQKQVD